MISWERSKREGGKMKRVVLLLLMLLVIIHNTDTWKFDKSKNVKVYNFSLQKVIQFPGPRLYGEKIPNRLISPRLRRVQSRIVMLHDFFRTKVVPTAANMLSMVRF